MKRQKATKRLRAYLSIALILTTAILFLSLGTLKLSDVFAAETTIECKSGGTYDVTQSGVTYDCRNLATLTNKTFNIKSNVSSVTFVGTADRHIYFMNLVVEQRTESLDLYLENMSFSGQADKTTIHCFTQSRVYILCSGKTYVRGGNRTFLNDDITKPQNFCCAVLSTHVEITGSGTIEFAGGDGFPWTGAQGGFAFFGTTLTLSAPNVTLRGGNGALGATGADGTTGAAGKIGGTGGKGGKGGDGRSAVLMPINGNLHIEKICNAILIGGNGGNGGEGGTGGKGGPGKDGAFLVSPVAGGTGGTGGTGGVGGWGMLPVNFNLMANFSITGAGTINGKTLNGNFNISPFIGLNGHGGDGGNGGTGGDGSYSMYGNPKFNPGKGGIGGEGGKGGLCDDMKFPIEMRNMNQGHQGLSGSAGATGNPRP